MTIRYTGYIGYKSIVSHEMLQNLIDNPYDKSFIDLIIYPENRESLKKWLAVQIEKNFSINSIPLIIAQIAINGLDSVRHLLTDEIIFTTDNNTLPLTIAHALALVGEYEYLIDASTRIGRDNLNILAYPDIGSIWFYFGIGGHFTALQAAIDADIIQNNAALWPHIGKLPTGGANKLYMIAASKGLADQRLFTEHLNQDIRELIESNAHQELSCLIRALFSSNMRHCIENIMNVWHYFAQQGMLIDEIEYAISIGTLTSENIRNATAIWLPIWLEIAQSGNFTQLKQAIDKGWFDPETIRNAQESWNPTWLELARRGHFEILELAIEKNWFDPIHLRNKLSIWNFVWKWLNFKTVGESNSPIYENNGQQILDNLIDGINLISFKEKNWNKSYFWHASHGSFEKLEYAINKGWIDIATLYVQPHYWYDFWEYLITHNPEKFKQAITKSWFDPTKFHDDKWTNYWSQMWLNIANRGSITELQYACKEGWFKSELIPSGIKNNYSWKDAWGKLAQNGKIKELKIAIQESWIDEESIRFFCKKSWESLLENNKVEIVKTMIQEGWLKKETIKQSSKYFWLRFASSGKIEVLKVALQDDWLDTEVLHSEEFEKNGWQYLAIRGNLKQLKEAIQAGFINPDYLIGENGYKFLSSYINIFYENKTIYSSPFQVLEDGINEGILDLNKISTDNWRNVFNNPSNYNKETNSAKRSQTGF